MSGAQPLSNGNILICYSSGMHFKEVNQEGILVWEYISSVGFNGPLYQGVPNFGSIFRATRYAADYPAFNDRDLSSQGPIELDPLSYDCDLFGETVTTTATVHTQLEIVQNPISEYLIITKEDGQRLLIRIFNISGQLLLEKESTEAQLAIPVWDLLSGVYFVHFSDPSQNGPPFVKKIIKK